MKKNDLALGEAQRDRIRREALRLLNKADALGRFPTPVDEVMSVAELEVVPEDLANPPLLRKLQRKAAGQLKRALTKVLGVFDVKAGLVFIDRTVLVVKQTFLKLHEIGHSFLPWQRDAYSVIEDCEGNLDPATADLFESEANFFATEVLFQLDGFMEEARDSPFGLKTPLRLQKKYGASAYSAIRQYVTKSERACIVVVLNPPEEDAIHGTCLPVRRVVPSRSWRNTIGAIDWPAVLLPSHPFWSLVPMGNRRMSSPRQIVVRDSDGIGHRCIAEAFKTPYNTFILIQAKRALRSRIVMPASIPVIKTVGDPSRT